MTKLALISRNENAFTETFIRQHREKLAGEIHYMYGGLLPLYADNGVKLIPDNPLKKIFLKIYWKNYSPRI